MKTILILVFAWLSLSCAGYGIGYLIFNPAGPQHMIAYGRPIYGTVTAKDPENHASIHYNYIVDGTTYSGKGSGRAGDLDFDQIKVGQQVIVVYDTTNPQKSVLGYPEEDLWASKTGIVFVTLTFSALWLVALSTFYLAIRAAKRANRDG